MDTYKKANRALWNEWTSIHEKSEFYDLESFKAGTSTLDPIELEELGDVSSKTLLHLQCHFGLDTLSWARLGAQVTGVDFSEKAIALARSLSKELSIPANFVCCDIYNLPNILSGEFDIVFTSGGVLSWLPDLQGWAQVIAHFLKPSGFFYIREFHPFAYIFDDREGVTDLRVFYPYFHSPEPMKSPVKGSYADRRATVSQPVEYAWAHHLGETLTSLISAGLRIEFLHEFPHCGYQLLPFMERGEDGMWHLKDQKESIPFMFSIKATKG
jgi:SAM-dependent methyltransferase